MSRIQTAFERLAGEGRKALIPFITAGDPDAALTVPLMQALVDAGADIIELGVPFSDPMADGPTIQRASERALAKGMTLMQVLALTRSLGRKTGDAPESFDWADESGARVRIEFVAGRCVAWHLVRTDDAAT